MIKKVSVLLIISILLFGCGNMKNKYQEIYDYDAIVKDKYGNNIKLEGSHLAINGYELTTNSSGFLFNAAQIDLGTVNNTSTLNVYGNAYITESARISNSLKFGDMVKATINTNGVDFDFVG